MDVGDKWNWTIGQVEDKIPITGQTVHEGDKRTYGSSTSGSTTSGPTTSEPSTTTTTKVTSNTVGIANDDVLILVCF